MGERPSGVCIGFRAKPQPWGRWVGLGEILGGLSVWRGEGCCRGLGCIRDGITHTQKNAGQLSPTFPAPHVKDGGKSP